MMKEVRGDTRYDTINAHTNENTNPSDDERMRTMSTDIHMPWWTTFGRLPRKRNKAWHYNLSFSFSFSSLFSLVLFLFLSLRQSVSQSSVEKWMCSLSLALTHHHPYIHIHLPFGWFGCCRSVSLRVSK